MIDLYALRSRIRFDYFWENICPAFALRTLLLLAIVMNGIAWKFTFIIVIVNLKNRGLAVFNLFACFAVCDVINTISVFLKDVCPASVYVLKLFFSSL